MRAQTFIHPLIQPADCPMTESPLLASAPSAIPPLRFAVMGAGAVGCYFGALLARAGHAVTLIGRPAHVLAVRDHGLRLQTAAMDVQVPLAASTEASAPVAAAVVYVATAMGGPGHVVHHGRGELVIAPSPRSDEVARQLTAAGIPTQVSDNVRGALWAKLVLNSAYNALSALSQQPYGPLVQVPGVTQVIADIVAECLAVAAADGVTIPGDVQAAVRGIASTMPGQYSSTAQDLARGKPTEIDHLNGYVVKRGAALGVPTPLNHALQVLVKLAEMKRAAG